MLFSSIFFLFYFLPVVIILNFIVPKKYKNYILLASSILFYSWGEPIYVFLMIFSSAFNYYMALDIYNDSLISSTRKKAKMDLIFTVAVNLFILSFFKYYGFLLDSINNLLGTSIHYTSLPLPIGISFYTFQALSYVIDIYRGDAPVQKNIFKFTLYLSLFPQLIAGPIVKYKDVAQQLDERIETNELRAEGTIRFIQGLGKKVLLANNFGALHQMVFSQGIENSSVLSLWLGILGFSMQIYFDFSGYSDMAIGLGKIFGFNFMENFKHPYIAKSVAEFWRRWHISLTTWIREYLYIPLGGNRVSKKRHIINLIIVWGFTGLWHGASWTFVIWGLYFALIMIMEKYVWSDWIHRQKNVIRHLYTLIIIGFSWVFFSSNSIAEAFNTIRSMLFLGGLYPVSIETFYLIKTHILLIITGALFATEIPYKAFELLRKKSAVMPILMLLFIFVLSTAYLVYSTYNPFLYFRF